MAKLTSTKRNKPTTPTEQDFINHGRDMMQRSEKQMGTMAVEERRYREMFGASPAVTLMAWNMICSAGLLPEGGQMIHWLWSLCFLKVYAKQGPLCVLCGGSDPKTISKWVWQFIRAFALLEGDIIAWENRKKGDKKNDCLVSVDGTDFKIAEHGPAFSSHKCSKKSALRCEVAMCILTGDVVWLNGPFACGRNPDVTIFRESLMSHLEDGERVEADDGCIGEHPQWIKCPKGFANPEETKESGTDKRQSTNGSRIGAHCVNGAGIQQRITEPQLV